MQLALERAIDASVDVGIYERLKDRLCGGLRDAGYDFVEPQGAFYVFARTPTQDDVLFSQQLQAENVLVVPGRGFGREGHIRIAFCVSPEKVEAALPRFAKVLAHARG